MRVTYFGGPKDGQETHINPRDRDVQQEYITVPTGRKLSDPEPSVDTAKVPGPFHTIKTYILHADTARYIWEDLHMEKL